MKTVLGLLCIAAVLTPLAHAHGRLRKPLSRDALLDIPIYLQNFQTGYGPDFGCRGYPPATPNTTLTAGAPLNVSWTFDANHPGDCFFYLSYDTNLNQSDQKWFKIAQFAECDKLNMKDQIVTIPDWIPACDHCVLRFEWYAIHMITIVEFYSQCVDVKIVSSANPGTLGFPQVKVPCHLPPNNPPGSNYYRNAFEGPFFFTGPALANGTENITATDYCASPPYPTSAPAPTPSYAPSPAPTNAPAPAPAPTPTQTPTGQCAIEWGQCGGSAYTGIPNCCPTNWICEYQSVWWSQCIPGTLPPTTTPAPTSSSAPAPTPSPTSSAAPESTTCTGSAPEWGKCGGIDITGTICCPTDWTCKRQNDWYWQCLKN